MVKYPIIDRRILNENNKHRGEIQLIDVYGERKIRFCYYTKIGREDGTVRWNFTVRPLQIPVDQIDKMNGLIQELLNNNI